MMLLTALLLAAPLTLTEPAGEPENLSTPEALQELCAALERTELVRPTGDPAEVARARAEHEQGRLRAAAKVYRVLVPSKGFAFGRYRASPEEVELDGDRPLRSIDDQLSLDVAGIDDVAFHASPAQLAAWNGEKKAGRLQLAVLFKPEDQRCAGSPVAKSYRIAGSPRGWQLLSGEGSPVAAADEAGLPVDPPAPPAADSKAAPGAPAAAATPKRSLQVARLSLDSDAADDSKARLEGIQGALDRCAAAARRSGALVVTFALQAGKVRDPQVIMDATRDEAASSCVARALVGAAVAGVGPASGRGTLSLQFE
jgi:hypothetical protein